MSPNVPASRTYTILLRSALSTWALTAVEHNIRTQHNTSMHNMQRPCRTPGLIPKTTYQRQVSTPYSHVVCKYHSPHSTPLTQQTKAMLLTTRSHPCPTITRRMIGRPLRYCLGHRASKLNQSGKEENTYKRPQARPASLITRGHYSVP